LSDEVLESCYGSKMRMCILKSSDVHLVDEYGNEKKCSCGNDADFQLIGSMSNKYLCKECLYGTSE